MSAINVITHADCDEHLTSNTKYEIFMDTTMELLGEFSITVGLGMVSFGSIYVAAFYLPERFSRAKKILGRIELLSKRSQSNGYKTRLRSSNPSRSKSQNR